MGAVSGNRTRGIPVQGLILHPEEPPLNDGPIVHLTHLPIYVLVKLDRTRASCLPGLDDRVVPIEPRATSMKFTVEEAGQINQRLGLHHQYPFTAGYALTDYRAQGQNLRHILLDIARPPQGSLSLFNLYVALSRSSGRSTIRLLRDFDVDVLRQTHNTFLLAEDDHINRLDRATQRAWSNAHGS